jgi:predicted metal-binding protein
MNEAAASAIEELVAEAHRRGAHETKVIDTCLLTPRQWVRMKCQFGCPAYGTNYTCPPHVPGLGEVERFIGEYSTALMVEFVDLETLVDQKKVLKALHAMEREALFAGLYKAFGIAAGPCHLCKVSKAAKGEPCHDIRPRPSLESLGIDVYELANAAGFELRPVHKKNDIFKSYGLLMLY